MRLNPKFDLQSESFNRFFSFEASRLTPEQKAKIPPEILAKVFLKDGSVTQNKLDFLLMLYVLYVSGSKSILVVVGDDEKGLGVADYEKFRKSLKRRKVEEKEVGHYAAAGDIFFGNRELMDWLSHLNSVCMSPAYRYALKLKNATAPKITDSMKEFFYFCNLLMTYEGNKKRIIRQEGVTIPELYILYYLADGREKRAVPIFTDVYRYAINASRKQIFDALKKLIAANYIQILGGVKSKVYKITPMGKTKLYKIIDKYMMS